MKEARLGKSNEKSEEKEWIALDDLDKPKEEEVKSLYQFLGEDSEELFSPKNRQVITYIELSPSQDENCALLENLSSAGAVSLRGRIC